MNSISQLVRIFTRLIEVNRYILTSFPFKTLRANATGTCDAWKLKTCPTIEAIIVPEWRVTFCEKKKRKKERIETWNLIYRINVKREEIY